MDNKCLQVKNFKYLCCKISYENEKCIQQKLATLAQTMGIFKDTFIPTWVQNSSRIDVHHTLVLRYFLHGSKIWILIQKKKKTDINQDKFF
jgi:hypothetical protein